MTEGGTEALGASQQEVKGQAGLHHPHFTEAETEAGKGKFRDIL